MNNLKDRHKAIERIKRVSKIEAAKHCKTWGISNKESAIAYELGYTEGYRAGASKYMINH